MKSELYNQSGCKDPTAYKAIKNLSKKTYFPLVYICSPFSGDINNNVKKARIYSRYALDKGNIPIAPHLLFPQFMSEEKERDLAMHFNYVLLGKCEELWVFGDYISSGMALEIDVAKKRKMKIKYISKEVGA
ncbi:MULTISPECIES: DUF7768 domain-containing protein [Helcococcus]|uniref:DUF4406 domain-containing protein n=1 Tax=Helcococcus bovis TaxID=3153252 RepID=A0ABW9F4U0_9FIRM